MTFRTDLKRDLCLSILLLATFSWSFAYHDGWKDAQAPGDEPAYVDQAYQIWHAGAKPDRLTWSPGYEVLMSPFVGVLGQEEGYKIFRFTLFAGISLLTYFAFSGAFRNPLIGVLLALLVQAFAVFYMAPALQALACLLYLICVRLLQDPTRNMGWVIAILLNTILISGAVSPLLASFAVLCLILYPRIVFSRRFINQLATGVVLFGLFLVRYGYSITAYPAEAGLRARAGLYHQLSLYIVRSGRSAPFLLPGEDSPENGVDDYHRHLKAIDRYYVSKFGQREYDLRAYSHDTRWPGFLLDWPWLFSKDPQLMREYRHEVLTNLRDSLRGAFGIVLRERRNGIDRGVLVSTSEVVFVVFVLTVSFGIYLFRRFAQSRPAMAWPSRPQILFLACSLSILVLLTLVMPLEIYVPPLVPGFLMACGLTTVASVKLLERFIPARTPLAHGAPPSRREFARPGPSKKRRAGTKRKNPQFRR